LRSVCALRTQLKAGIGAHGDGLVAYLVNDCLFGLPSVESYTKQGLPKCKRAKTRWAAFELLYALADDCTPNVRLLIDRLFRHHLRREFRSLCMYRPWLLDKAPSGFVGLRNLGATCYMNSLLQQLFFVPECRSNMLQVSVEDRQSFMYHLQLLFAHLQESEKQYYDTWELSQVYTDGDGQPVNINQQMDVDEFLNVLFDKVEQGLRDTPQKDMLRDCFGGKIVHQIICKEPVTVGAREFTLQDPYKSEREESFFVIQLEVKHKRSILESLRLYVDGETLEGDNKYFCEDANKKVDAVKRVCIKELPQTLILQLKRFEFDLDFMKKVKVNDCCEFPLTLDMDPYTLDGIERREKAAAEAASKGLDGAKAMEDVESAPDSEYELVGVLVHTGTADSGHYYSYIKERSAGEAVEGGEKEKAATWYLFNDVHVEPFNSQELGAASFGGCEYVEELDPSDASRSQTKLVSRPYSAYMLFYERKSAKKSGARLELEKASKVPASPAIVDAVLEDNLRFLRDKHTYDPEYFSFLKKVCSKTLEEEELEDRATMLAVQVLMDSVIHGWDTEQVSEWVLIIQNKLRPDAHKLKRSSWLLETFMCMQESNGRVYGHHWFKKALLTHRVQDCRSNVVKLLMHAIQNLAPSERDAGSAIPYCMSRQEDDTEILVQQDGVYVSSLMTDYPFARAAAYRGTPFPRPVTAVGRFIDAVLDLLPEVSRFWRFYGEYFQLLANFASLGREETVFLLSRRTVSRIIDQVLLDESSGAHGRLDKFTGPDWSHLMTLLSTLVRSVKLERDFPDEGEEVPTQLCGADPLDPACSAYVRKSRFIYKVVSEGANPKEALKLFEHLCWNHAKNTILVLENIVGVLDEAHDDETEVLYKMLEKLVSMRDQHQAMRAQNLVFLLLRMVLEKTLYSDPCPACLTFFENLSARNEHVRAALLTHIVSQRRDVGMSIQAKWFEECLIRNEMERVQLLWEKLARTLALPRVLLRKQAAANLQGKAAERSAPVAKVEADELTKTLFHYLVRDDKVLVQACADPRETGFGPYPLRYYFKLLCFIVEHADSSYYKKMICGRLRLFQDLLRRLNSNEVETDYAKAELHRLLLIACEGNPDLLDAITNENSAMRRTLVSNFIMVRHHRINVAFNRQHLPWFYRLLLLCSRHSVSFTEYLMEADELIWAITHLMCKSQRYPETSAVLLELIDVMLSSEANPDKRAFFSERVLGILLSTKDLAAGPENVVELSNRLVLGLLGKSELLYKVLDSYVIDALLSAVGACYPQQAMMGQRSRTPPEARTFKVALLAIELIQKILHAIKSTAAADARDELERALKVALMKSKYVAYDHRHKAMSAMMYVVLPTVDLLPTSHRLMTLEVATTLCGYDVECITAGADALIKLYDETKLKQVEYVRLEHLQGAQQQSGKAVQGAGEASGVKKAEQAWLYIQRRADVKPPNRVVEFGPACRARPGVQGTQEEHDEVEAKYSSLALTLCKGLMCWSQSSNDHLVYAVRLMLQCAVDLLPLATLAQHAAVQELLLECVVQSTRPRAEGGEASSSGSGAEQPPGVPNTSLFVQLLRQENLAYDWVERVMLCYKEGIESKTLRHCSQLMLASLAPTWPSERFQRINHVLVSDLTELARAACVVTEAGLGATVGSASERAEALARAVLRELRPLVLVDEIPKMLAELINSHGEAACVAAAEEALQAANCRNLAPSSQSLSACIAEIDSIVGGHKEAVRLLQGRAT